MLFRNSIAIILIVLGVASPWIVRDYMDPASDDHFADQFCESVKDASESIRQSLSSDSGEAVESQKIANTAESSIEPYPFADKTWRVIQGFFSPETKISPQGRSVTPSALVRKDAITDSVEKGLEKQLSSLGFSLGDPLFVRIFKEERELEIWMRAKGDEHYSLFKIMRITEFAGGLGPKLREGDGQVPEGFYYVPSTHLRPDTRHHLGIDIGFPNAFDRHFGRSGSELLIHGGESAAGSFALGEHDIEVLYTLAEASLVEGQDFFRVNIFPFRMTDDRMDTEWEKKPRWLDFWVNLKEGYDFFENANFPPDAGVEGGKYVFRIE